VDIDGIREVIKNLRFALVATPLTGTKRGSSDTVDWYEKNIEEPIRNLVRLLRENGYNTDCSCGHLPKPYIQIDWHGYDTFKLNSLYNLLVENGYANFKISAWILHTEHDRNQRTAEITFYPEKKLCKENDLKEK